MKYATIPSNGLKFKFEVKENQIFLKLFGMKTWFRISMDEESLDGFLFSYITRCSRTMIKDMITAHIKKHHDSSWGEKPQQTEQQ